MTPCHRTPPLSCLLLLLILLPSILGLSTTTKSIGEAIQVASTTPALLQVASQFWLPYDPDLPSHLQTQRIHHEKRQRWSAQLIEKLAATTSSRSVDGEEDSNDLERAILAASIPFGEDRPGKEGRYVKQALCGLYALFRKNQGHISISQTSMDGILQLIDRADEMAAKAFLPLSQVVEMRWAARGLLATMPGMPRRKLDNLESRVKPLPFDILPNVLDWKTVLSDSEQQFPLEKLIDIIPFSFDVITTKGGAKVVERRGTAWLAEPGIGALAYSGKLMPPHELPEEVSAAMRAVEQSLQLGEESFFDCALCNHYPDAEAACKFHTDPEHGTLWERLTCVVAAGDCRKFAFRPIPGASRWSDWDVDGVTEEQSVAAAIHLFEGDVVVMYNDCNDLFHHAVYTDDNLHHDDKDAERVSLVLKRAIDRGGKRGHGLQGEGRRARRKSASAATRSNKKRNRP